MTLTNYWWLLIWMFTGAAFLAIFVPKRQEIVFGQKVERWAPWAAVAAVVPYIIWTGFRSDSYGDTAAYRKAFQDAPAMLSKIPEYMKDITKDKGFYAFSAVLKSVFGSEDVLYFTLIAAIQLLILAWLYRKYSSDYWMSIFLFIASSDYLSWSQNGIRQFMAVAIVLLAAPFMIKRKIVPAIVIILLAATMHQSALIMIPLMLVAMGKPWNKRTLLFIGAIILAIAFVGRFTSLLDTAMQETQYANVVSDWTSWQDDGTSKIRVLVYAVPTVLSFIGLRYIKDANDPVIDFCTNMSIISTGIYAVSTVTSGIFIGRLPIYASLFNYILLPWELEHIFQKNSAQLIRIAAVLLYVAFFYYQMHFAWGFL